MNKKIVHKGKAKSFFTRMLAKAVIELELFLEDNRCVSRETVRLRVEAWKNNANLALYKMTAKYQQSSFANVNELIQESSQTLPYTLVHRRILPSVDTIRCMVESASNKHRSKIEYCQTQSDLDYVIACLDGEHQILEVDVAHRIMFFKDCIRKRDRSFQFIGDLRILYAHMALWRDVPVKHDILLEDTLMEMLNRIFVEWERFSEEKTVSKLDDFFESIDFDKANVYDLVDRIIPKKKNGKRFDIESLIMGFGMKQYSDCLM